ncbi:hypothetical protein KQI42_17435 [Tissierella sp. MSJ-40]|uniref:Uncharacterized protein n=1 Tax=Tissierella simiarum TaxID=2841534 RepID=A0ABS6EA38_9FIRM|nr:hypothetical protein [Tissierella simiarum]MBU5439802.1 hypothetical protein [Tissierella simiarum]
MGTSKGYIPPKNAQWKQAKGAVTRMLGTSKGNEGTKEAISKYAEAYMSTHLANSNVTIVAGGVMNFLNSISVNGINATAQLLGLDSLLNKSGNELYKEILDYFARDFSTIDMQIIRDSLSETFKYLEVDTFEDFGKIASDEFLINFLIEFAVKNFEACFAEKILSKSDLANDYDQIMDDVSSIIENKIVTDSVLGETLQLDYLSKEGQDYIMSVCRGCFNTLSVMGDGYENLD